MHRIGGGLESKGRAAFSRMRVNDQDAPADLYVIAFRLPQQTLRADPEVVVSEQSVAIPVWHSSRC
jgi:hypothetical protein